MVKNIAVKASGEAEQGMQAVTSSFERKRSNVLRVTQGFTLAEVVISMVILTLALAAILGVYVQSGKRAEWSAYSLSAQMMAISGMERCRAAKYDPRGTPPTDNLVSSNFPPYVDVIDVGTMSTNLTYATNQTTITTIFTNPPLKMVRVDCSWTFPGRGTYTNTVTTYRAANQ